MDNAVVTRFGTQPVYKEVDIKDPEAEAKRNDDYMNNETEDLILPEDDVDYNSLEEALMS